VDWLETSLSTMTKVRFRSEFDVIHDTETKDPNLMRFPLWEA